MNNQLKAAVARALQSHEQDQVLTILAELGREKKKIHWRYWSIKMFILLVLFQYVTTFCNICSDKVEEENRLLKKYGG